MDQQFEPVIGLEVHVELATRSKMFCGCSADYFGHKPNTDCCPVCLGLPGALPVPNRKAVEWCIMLGLALGCSIPEVSKFDRKHYFYPDLPKGYQISQYDQPLCIGGLLSIALPGGSAKPIRIRRVHMEEDTGKLLHETVDGRHVSLIDFNRSGVPLVEIVTEPDFCSVDEVDIYLKKLQEIVRYLGISNADMEKGSMRLEPSISMRKSQIPMTKSPKNPTSQDLKALPPYRVELKNINSFRFGRKALEYEIARQTEVLVRGEEPVQETRGWNEGKNMTVPQRHKEEANDYRYFPEPDIPPMQWRRSQISVLRSRIPELPDAKRSRFTKDYGLNAADAVRITERRQRADYFEEAVRVGRTLGAKAPVTPKQIANWLINRGIDTETVLPAELVKRIMEASEAVTVSDDDVDAAIQKAITDNPKAAADYKNGKEASLMFLMGQVRKQIAADPKLILTRLKELLANYSL
ncbi:Asp-tRNA(Asn)/Glu-tRNA(Gln) amidotransferase subunit GatB [Patescibacteria group bacterium]|nr:Asp-tRNA(Asn)/Glu-tRNA(Gln) amidotransferase subunit GatB [Patescibacteria group bacterium]